MNVTRLFPQLRTSFSRNHATSHTSRLRTLTMVQSTPRPTLCATRHALMTHAARVGRRSYSSEGSSRTAGLWSPLFTALLLFGVAATGYGVYEMYATLTMWPQEVRDDLREALKAKHKDDLSTSAAYLQRAWETAKTTPVDLFKTQPYLKTSGIAICLGEVLEGADKKSDAYDVYADALKHLQEAGIRDMTGPEKMRAVALAYKLGELCEVLEKPKEEQEQRLTFAVETVLKHVLEVPVPAEAQAASYEGEHQAIITELSLPDWVSTVDVAAPLEALGTFYSRAGKLDFAMPLMLRAASILVPPPPQESTPEDRCRGAQLMTSISEMIVRDKLSQESVQQAEQWAMKGLEVVVATRKASPHPIGMCEVAYAVQLFNMASLRAIGGDINKAKELFVRSANQAKAIGYQALVDTSNQALEELNSRTTAPKTT